MGTAWLEVAFAGKPAPTIKPAPQKPGISANSWSYAHSAGCDLLAPLPPTQGFLYSTGNANAAGRPTVKIQELKMSGLNLHPEAAASLNQWHDMIRKGDLSALPELLDPQAIFRSPMAHKPYLGAVVVSKILNTVIEVFEDFVYHRELTTADGLSVVLEFSANVDGKALKGIDMIRFNEQGKIVEFEVMVRPFSALQALGEQMGQRVGAYLAAL
jgi:hypothetical protein